MADKQLAKVKVFKRAANAPWDPDKEPIPADWDLTWFVEITDVPLCEFIHANEPQLLAEEIVAMLAGDDDTAYPNRPFQVGDMFVMYRNGAHKNKHLYLMLERTNRERNALYESRGYGIIASMRFDKYVLVVMESTHDPRNEDQHEMAEV